MREPATEPREFTLTIPNEAFNAHRLRFQDAPDVCSLKLRRELAAHANHPPETHFDITDVELEDYRSTHAPRMQEPICPKARRRLLDSCVFRPCTILSRKATAKETPVGRITFQKRQKEMKRQEKQKAKAERREQRKLEKPADLDASIDTSSEARTGGFDFSADPEPHTPRQ